MTLRFHRRLGVIPGLRLNFSLSGPSVSIGRRGVWYTIGPRGRRLTVGAPGTGLYWTESYPPAAPPHAGHRGLFLLAVAAGIAALAVAANW